MSNGCPVLPPYVSAAYPLCSLYKTTTTSRCSGCRVRFGVRRWRTRNGTVPCGKASSADKRSLERLRNIVCHERVTANLYSLQTLSNDLCVKHLVVRRKENHRDICYPKKTLTCSKHVDKALLPACILTASTAIHALVYKRSDYHAYHGHKYQLFHRIG